MWVGLVQSAEGLNRTKRLASSQVIEFLLPDCLQTGTLAFLLLLDSKHWLFLCLEPVGLQMGATPSAHLVLRPSDSYWN